MPRLELQPTPTVDTAVEKRRANDFMRAGLRHFEPGEPIPFFCECGRASCYKPVWLTRVEYDARRSDPGWRAVSHALRGRDSLGLAAGSRSGD